MKILVIHGPNLNMLGKRDPAKYGTLTMTEINKQLQIIALELDCELEFFQSNHEGAILDFLQREPSRAANGIIINPGALMHYGYSLRQALVDLGKPTIEVHMSDIHKTEIKTGVNVLEVKTGMRCFKNSECPPLWQETVSQCHSEALAEESGFYNS